MVLPVSNGGSVPPNHNISITSSSYYKLIKDSKNIRRRIFMIYDANMYGLPITSYHKRQ